MILTMMFASNDKMNMLLTQCNIPRNELTIPPSGTTSIVSPRATEDQPSHENAPSSLSHTPTYTSVLQLSPTKRPRVLTHEFNPQCVMVQLVSVFATSK